MARSASVILALLLVGAAMPTAAQLFVCTTKSGKRITGDQPPAECRDVVIRELRSDGSIKSVIEPPLTAEQKAQREVERKKQLADEEIAREQLRKDKALLEAYGSEAEIQDARDRQIAQRNQMVETAAKRLEGHQRERKKLDSELEFYANRPVPDALKRRIDANATISRSEEKIIVGLKADIARINERFDDDLKRYRDMAAATQTHRTPSAAGK